MGKQRSTTDKKGKKGKGKRKERRTKKEGQIVRK